jgi:hypothetical protein
VEDYIYDRFFHRKHNKKLDLKQFERSTVSTLLIPKHLENLHLVLPVVLDATTMKKSYNLKAGLKKLLEKYRGSLALGYLPVQEKPKLTYKEGGVGTSKVFF